MKKHLFSILIAWIIVLPTLFFVGNWCAWRYESSKGYDGTYWEWVEQDWHGLKNSLSK